MLSQNSFLIKMAILHIVALWLLCSFLVVDAPQAMMELHFCEQLIIKPSQKKSSVKLAEN